MRARLIVCLLGAVSVLTFAVPARASHIKQIDMSDAFNADVVVNGTTLVSIDDTQKSVDASSVSLITQTAARLLPDCTDDPDGLPNDGVFPANDDHPRVDLAYDNASDGRNAWRSSAPGSFRVLVPQARYRSMHVFATSGDGGSTIRVKLLFVTGDPVVKQLTVPDWFSHTKVGYDLIDGMDRGEPDGSQCYDENAAAIYGFKISTNPQRKLKAVRIINEDIGESVLNVFGMTGRQVGDH